jgi:hypothetical protein
VAGFGAKQDGFCVKADGVDQNSGVILLDGLDGYPDDGDLHKECLEMCAVVIGVTGCEMIWDQNNKGCYAHTDNINGGGNGVVRHSCYLVEEEAKIGGCTGYEDVQVGDFNCPVEMMIDGEKQGTIDFDDPLANVKQDGKQITIEYPGVLKVVMKLSHFGRCFFSVDVDLYDCTSYADSAIGLLGSPNYNSRDDWTDQNGNVLDLPSDVSNFFFEPAFNYVKDNWIINDPDNTLFTYDTCSSFETLAAPDEQYDPAIEVYVNRPQPLIAEICGDDVQCRIDGGTLGSDAAEEFIENPAKDRVPVDQEGTEVLTEEPEEEEATEEPERERSEEEATEEPERERSAEEATEEPERERSEEEATASPTESLTTEPNWAETEELSPTNSPTASPTESLTAAPTLPTEGQGPASGSGDPHFKVCLSNRS